MSQKCHQQICINMKIFVNFKFRKLYFRKDGFLGFKTNKYKMNYYETPSGIKFVLNTDLNPVGNTRELLHQIYENVLLPTVIKNVNLNLQEPIKNIVFENKLEDLIKNSMIFKN